ncbi:MULTISPECIES: SDR family oxidoreductase [unclassified Cupriavidus]|uniref:SDR family oxidoreductase n=1 Tax=unclassified Cupriavidus TaxID=2640874 RepID=UPI00313B283A
MASSRPEGAYVRGLPQQTAIVTSAARGIGAAMARKLATQGFNVVVNHPVDDAAAQHVVTAIRAAGGRAIAVRADVSRHDAFAQLFDAATAEFGGVDVLVNNAGLASNMPIGSIDELTFDRMFAINVRGVLNGLKLAAQRMRDNGRIVNISTSVAGMSPAGYGSYCASKAAVEALTRSLSKQLGPRGIRVNAVAPGPTGTGLVTHMRDLTTPLGRIAELEDIAEVVAFLVSDSSGWINGQSVRVNGGILS